MSQDYELALATAAQDMRQRYVYFILTATGACIGFAVTQSRDAHVSLQMIPLALAAIAWAMSFFLGCRALYWKPVSIAHNIELLKARSGRNPVAGNHVEAIRIAVDTFTKNFDQAMSKFAIYVRLQFALFVVGSVLFLAWHALEIWVRSVPFAA